MKARPLVLGIVVGAVGIVLLLLYMRRFEQEASGGRKIELLVTVQPVVRGKPFTEEMLGVREVPQAYVDERDVRLADKQKIMGLRATNTISVGQTLGWNDVVASTDDRRDLSALIQPGNRAMPIKVTQDDILSLIRPGDFVDIIAVLGNDTKDATVLLQRVLVLSTGMNLSFDSDKKVAERVSMITVSVSLQESQMLALAMEKGRLTAVVRNPDDQRVAETPPDVSQNALMDNQKRQSLTSSRRRVGTGPVRLEATP